MEDRNWDKPGVGYRLSLASLGYTVRLFHKLKPSGTINENKTKKPKTHPKLKTRVKEESETLRTAWGGLCEEKNSHTIMEVRIS